MVTQRDTGFKVRTPDGRVGKLLSCPRPGERSSFAPRALILARVMVNGVPLGFPPEDLEVAR